MNPSTPWYTSLIQGTTAIPRATAKLIETVGKQLGHLMEPTHIRRKTRAEAESRIEDAKADAEIKQIEENSKIALKDIKARAAERIRRKEERRQENIEKIIKTANDILPDDVSDQPVDADWTAQFFENSQDVSDEQMQSIWSRILAGEIAKPDSYSTRTLAAVKQLSKREADTFSRFCNAIWILDRGPTAIIPHESDSKVLLPQYNIHFEDLMLLDTIGLITFNFLNGFVLKFDGGDINLRLQYNQGKYVISKTGAAAHELSLGPVMLTTIGRELQSIVARSPNQSYEDAVLEFFRQKGWNVA